MDTINVIELEPSTYKYKVGMGQLFRDIEDPFSKEIPAEMTFESKAIGSDGDPLTSNWVRDGVGVWGCEEQV